jgi:Uma2 family endonuclease
VRGAGDGITVEIGDGHDYEPDAVVNGGDPLPGSAAAAPKPVVVVEVLSPSSRSTDTGARLADHFQAPSVRHCLVLQAGLRQVTHRWRSDDAPGIQTGALVVAAIRLDPPGFEVAVAGFHSEA